MTRLSPCIAPLVSCLVAVPAPATAEDPTMEKAPPEERLFVHGPEIVAGFELESWLLRRRDEQGNALLVRLPVAVRLDDASAGVLGASLETDEATAVRLDDAALGISLADRARHACPGDAWCRLWLEGVWTGSSQGDRRFAVSRVVRPVAAAERDGPLFARTAVGRGARPDLVAGLDRLGGDAAVQEKREADRLLVTAGKDAVPLLIASLGDGRPYERRDITNRMNLPHDARPAPLFATTTVGMHVVDLLYEIITPFVDSPHAGKFKVYSEQVLSVEDWPGFWARHGEKSLEQIHEMLAPLVQAYWKEHGTTQRVP